ncbi:substrate-binding periplasmic protein [Motiliproteus sediminis]|uniref:substrate-binding periplasmic protein n=1 Tax=Motiliproteus sediminis TaxID=1468178 RepID=UPI001AEF3FFF|nr:transporter substrate-binding domain-containing protein [Motiliproteus sediminis]
MRLVLGLLCVLLGSAVWADEERVIRLVTHEFPPFSTLKEGEVSGPARTLVDRVCAELAVRCEHELLPWARAQARVRAGDADGMYVIGWNAERARWLNFSTPLLSTEYGVFVGQSNQLRYAEPVQLAGLKIGVYGPSNTSRSLAQLQRLSGVAFRIDVQGDSELLLRQLEAGRLDAVYGNRDVGLALMRDAGIKGVRYAGRHRQLDYFVGFSQQTTDSDWNLRFSRAYQALAERGTVADILLSYGLQP